MKIFDPKIIVEIFANNEKITLDSFYMEFDVFLTDESEPNAADISIYNLAESTRNVFTESYQAINVYAGYGDAVGLIFSGQIINVEHERDNSEWKTTIYCGDGIKEYCDKYFAKTYSAGTSIGQILRDLCKETGLAYQIDTQFVDEKLLKSETFCGRVKDILNQICNDYFLSWSILHGTLEIGLKNSPFSSDPVAIVLSFDTGLLENPSMFLSTVDQVVSVKKGKKTVKETVSKEIIGVSILSVLQAEFKPNRLVKLQGTRESSLSLGDNKAAKTKTLDRIYRVNTVHFYGDNFGGDFVAELTADMPPSDNPIVQRAMKDSP